MINIQKIIDKHVHDFEVFHNETVPIAFHFYIYRIVNELIGMKSRENISDEELLRIYMLGFNDELLDKKYAYGKDILLSSWEHRAYANGRVDALIGDEISMIDLQTDEQILKRIKI